MILNNFYICIIKVVSHTAVLSCHAMLLSKELEGRRLVHGRTIPAAAWETKGKGGLPWFPTFLALLLLLIKFIY